MSGTTAPLSSSGLHRPAPMVSSVAPADVLRVVRDPLRLLLFALLLLTVSRVHQHYPQLMRLRPALLLVIAAAGFAYLNPRMLTSAKVLTQWPMRLIGALGLLACGSAVFGISLGRSASFILDSYFKTVLIAFLIAASVRHARDLVTFVWAYVAACGVLAFFSLFVFGISRSGNKDFARLANLYTWDANDLGLIMIVGLPLTLLLLTSVRGKARLPLIAIFIGISATIARSGSRGGFLGFVAVAIAGLLLVNSVSSGRRFAILLTTLVALGVGAPPGYWKQMSTVLEPKSDYNYSAVDGRKALAERGLFYMSKYPVFGIGMNNFARAECTISPKLETLSRTGPVRCRFPHNSYVQAGAELGVPGLFIWVLLELGLIVAPLRLRRRLPQSWRRGNSTERFLYGATTFFPLAMIGFAVTSFFVSFAWMEPLYIMAALTTGLYGVIRQELRRSGLTGVSAASVATRRPVAWRMRQSAQPFQIAAAFSVGKG